ncbi:hypothetical protein ACJX0J_016616, partial [Zea mays]
MQRRFLYHARMEKWVLKTIGERWRQHKSNLKSIYYDRGFGTSIPTTSDLKELLAEHPEFADTSQGKIAWNGDALNKILGEEKPGHVWDNINAEDQDATIQETPFHNHESISN